MALDLHFSKEDIQMAKKHTKSRRHTDGQEAHEKLLNITNDRKMQIKITIRYHLIPVRTAIIRKSTNNKCWRGCGEKAVSIYIPIGGNVN